MDREIYSKQEIWEFLGNELSEDIHNISVSEQQLFCIVDKYLIPECQENDEFSFFIINRDKEQIKSIKLKNGFFDLKGSLKDIFGASYQSANLIEDIVKSKFSYNSVFLIFQILIKIYNVSKMDFGKDEYFVVTLLHNKNFMLEENMYEEYSRIKEVPFEDARKKVSAAINNLNKFNCLNLMDGKVSLVEKIWFDKGSREIENDTKAYN